MSALEILDDDDDDDDVRYQITWYLVTGAHVSKQPSRAVPTVSSLWVKPKQQSGIQNTSTGWSRKYYKPAKYGHHQQPNAVSSRESRLYDCKWSISRATPYKAD